MAILALANQKGGTGKTTTALNLGYGLAELGRRVLLVDLDPQASLTLATVGECTGRSMAEVLGDTKPGSLAALAIVRNLHERLDLAPGDLALSNTELGLVTRLGRESVLKKALASLAGNYDFILLDCGPTLGVLVVNALVAAECVICPTLPTALDLRGLRLFLKSLEDMRELNPGLALLGVIVCQYSDRLNLHRAALADLRAGDLPVLGIIGKSIKAAEQAGVGQPLTRGDLADQYKTLAVEVNQWLTKS
jgi:chromosome partitioning protein